MAGVELLLVQLRVGLLGVRVWRGHLWDDIEAAHQHHLHALGGSNAGPKDGLPSARYALAARVGLAEEG